jgi:hypothetical protein
LVGRGPHARALDTRRDVDADRGDARRARATFIALRPPARMTGTSRAIAAASRSAPRSRSRRMGSHRRVEHDPLGAGIEEPRAAARLVAAASVASPGSSAGM